MKPMTLRPKAMPPAPFAVRILLPSEQDARLAVCRTNVCGLSVNGRCKACCGAGTPLEIIVRLNVSVCAKGLWTA